MVVLKNIKANNRNQITCKAFVEDCKTPIDAAYDTQMGTLNYNSLPVGYEWCMSHMAKAQEAISEMVRLGEVSTQKTVMWY